MINGMPDVPLHPVDGMAAALERRASQ